MEKFTCIFISNIIVTLIYFSNKLYSLTKYNMPGYHVYMAIIACGKNHDFDKTERHE